MFIFISNSQERQQNSIIWRKAMYIMYEEDATQQSYTQKGKNLFYKGIRKQQDDFSGEISGGSSSKDQMIEEDDSIDNHILKQDINSLEPSLNQSLSVDTPIIKEEAGEGRNHNKIAAQHHSGSDADWHGLQMQGELQFQEITPMSQENTPRKVSVSPEALTPQAPSIKKRRFFSQRKGKKNRKIRTTITKQKLSQMNRIFAEYTSQKQQGKNPQFNLKQIGQQLQLGYSTILHKFRQFRATKKVKGGALIASLQKKRKYRKSIQIQQIIQRALAQRPFFTAVQLSRHIFLKNNRNFSRSIISRHLGEMGYSYKNLKSTPIEKNKQKYKQIRKLYATIMQPLISDPKSSKNIIYIDEMACSVSNFIKRKNFTGDLKKNEKQTEEYVSVLIAARCEKLVYYQIRQGFISRSDFCRSLQVVRQNMTAFLRYEQDGQNGHLLIITDLNRIHREGSQADNDLVAAFLHRNNMRQYFLPPYSFQLNPLQTIFVNIKNKLSKKDIRSVEELKNQLHSYMQQLQKENVDVHFKEIPQWIEKSLRDDNF